MNKNGVVAVVVAVISIVLIGLWAMRGGQQGYLGDCSGPPTPPTNITSEVIGNTVTLRWTPPPSSENITAYLIEATTNRATEPTVFVAPGSQNMFVREAPAATYYVRVRSRNNCGTGEVSPELVVPVK
jgi:hypothetical protein